MAYGQKSTEPTWGSVGDVVGFATDGQETGQGTRRSGGRDRCRAGDESRGRDERADRRGDDDPQPGTKMVDHVVWLPSGDGSPVYGRRDELSRLIQIAWSCRLGNNAALCQERSCSFRD